MKFKNYLIEQLKIHQSMEPCDVAKMCYQAAHGAEHLLVDLDRAKKFFYQEFDSMEANEEPVFEHLSDHVSRINFGGWKSKGLPAEWLFEIFAESTKGGYGGKALLEEYLIAAESVCKKGLTKFDKHKWQEFVNEYKADGMNPIHHSQKYRDAEKPTYRVVDRKYTRLIPILARACQLAGGVIVIDGYAASGKSTMASHLSMLLDAPIVRVDDFFLPLELRTEERLAEAGGNVHYERFKEEVLPGLANGDVFEYTRFDCSIMGYGDSVVVPTNKWRIVEGSYSQHPYFGQYGDVRVFSNVDAEEQMRRILLRNGEEMAKRFENIWIPMENRYFETYNINELADVTV